MRKFAVIIVAVAATITLSACGTDPDPYIVERANSASCSELMGYWKSEKGSADALIERNAEGDLDKADVAIANMEHLTKVMEERC